MSIALDNTSFPFSIEGGAWWNKRIVQEAVAIVGTKDVDLSCEVEEEIKEGEESHFQSTLITDSNLPVPGGLLSISIDGDSDEVPEIKEALLKFLSDIGAVRQPQVDYVFTMPDNTMFAFSVDDGNQKLNTRLAREAFRALAAVHSCAALVCTVQHEATAAKDPESRGQDGPAEDEVKDKKSETMLIKDPKLPVPRGLLSITFDGEPSAILAIQTKMMAFLAKVPVVRQSRVNCIAFAMQRTDRKKKSPANANAYELLYVDLRKRMTSLV
jgi:hypothetical protein